MKFKQSFVSQVTGNNEATLQSPMTLLVCEYKDVLWLQYSLTPFWRNKHQNVLRFIRLVMGCAE